ncbi:MAG: DUF302 domain-containing protein [Acidobacteria bacterium]|nr:DUF302 domain-containing protein [Acidobacteriota bacterium]
MTNNSEYGIKRELALTFDEALEKTKDALKTEGFGVLTEIDLKAKFKEKLEKEFGNYIILGACNPKYAFEALGKDMDLGLLLPCNVVVYEENGATVVAAIDAKKMLSVTGRNELDEFAGDVNAMLRRAIESI